MAPNGWMVFGFNMTDNRRPRGDPLVLREKAVKPELRTCYQVQYDVLLLIYFKPNVFVISSGQLLYWYAPDVWKLKLENVALWGVGGELLRTVY